MKKQFKLGVIGGGFMAQAILKGVISSNVIKSEQIIVADISQTALQKLEYLRVNLTTDCVQVAKNCEFLLFAVKPQNFPDVANELSQIQIEKVISIMAGVKKQKIRTLLNDEKIKVARAMPNLPCSVNKGMTAVDVSDFLNEDSEFIGLIFKNIGNLLFISEEKLNAVTGISGSGPAYVYMFIDGLIKAGITHGLTEEEAKILAVSTVAGGAEMVFKSQDKTLDELISAVCSKGGTTIEAVNSFKNDGLYQIIDTAVGACVKRAEELSK